MSIIQSLIEFRDRQAGHEGVESYKILQYKTIEEIARLAPATFAELEQIKGIGPAKLKKYGKQILGIVEGVVNPNSQTSNNKQNSKFKTQNFEADNNNNDNSQKTTVRKQNTEADSTSPLDTPHAWGGGSNKQTVRVGEYLEYLNFIFAKTADVRIVGEITGTKLYSSGIYFSLKDKEDGSILGCFLPQYTYKGLGIVLEDGMEVAVEGVPRLVKRNGRFQFTVENVELVGEGALKKAYDLLKARLEEEGLFSRKRELPEFIHTIGIITSRAGAVIHDFRNNLPKLGFKIILKDVRVEGINSAPMIIDAVKWFNDIHVIPSKASGHSSHRQVKDELQTGPGMTVGIGSGTEKRKVDALVIMRGGGSLEDMQAFNNEQVIRAIYASNIPTIVAIGHDQDVPLAQLIADSMVSTPTAAAKLIEHSWSRLIQDLPKYTNSILNIYKQSLEHSKFKVNIATESLSGFFSRISQNFKHTVSKVVAKISWYKLATKQLEAEILAYGSEVTELMHKKINELNTKLLQAEGIVSASSPTRLLGLGYSILRTEQGKVIKSSKDVNIGMSLISELSDGTVESQVTKKHVSGKKS